MNLTRIFRGADPFLMKHGGKYYIYCTTENIEKLESPSAFKTDKDGKDGFYVYQSEDLIHWENKGLCLSKNDVAGEKWFWAPEVSYYKGKFYMVYTAQEHLAIAVSDNPTGPFKKYEYNPILKKKGNVIGVGHNSYMPTDDENRFICAYHCHSGNPDNFKPRMVCLCEAAFEKNNDIDRLRIYY